MKLTWPIRWPAHFVPTALMISSASSSSVAPLAQQGPEVELPGGEEARAELALGRQADPVAVAAERPVTVGMTPTSPRPSR